MDFDLRKTAREKIILVAHRGVAGGNIPCNTIPSYEIALAQGADMIEIDVDMSADGELFIFHPGMEPAHLGKSVDIRKMNSDEIRELRYVNYDNVPTTTGLNTLDEVLEHLKGKCFINVDKFGDNPAEIIAKLARHDMKDQIVLKCAPDEASLSVIEKYASDIQFLPVIWKDNGTHEMLKNRDINYVGAELLFRNENEDVGRADYRELLHRDRKLCWINTIVYDYRAVISAGHTDDAALCGDPASGWGWSADNFDIIQTDWVLALKDYLKKTGRK